jgi:hypothetical protein
MVYAYANGIDVVVESLDLFRLRAIAAGGRMIPSGHFSFTKRTLVGWMSGSWTKKVGIDFADGLCDLAESFLLKASMIRVRGPCPFVLYSGICLTTEEKHGKSQSGQPSIWTPLVAPTWPLFRAASTALLSISPPQLTVRDFRQPMIGLPSCQTNWFPVLANFDSKLSVSALMWLAKNGIPKSSLICLLPTLQVVLVTMRRHFYHSTCSFRMWLRAADLQIGYAQSIIGRMNFL